MRTTRIALVALLALAAGGCVHMPCWCDDPDANPVRPGQDGRRSALGPGSGYNRAGEGRHAAAPQKEESRDA